MYSRQHKTTHNRSNNTSSPYRQHRRLQPKIILKAYSLFCGPGSVAGIATGYGSDWLQAGRSEDRIPVGVEIFRTCPDRPWGPLSLLYNGYQIFPGVKSDRGVTLTPHPLLVPWSRKARAIPLLPLWAVRPVQSINACTRVHFAFNFNLHFKNRDCLCDEMLGKIIARANIKLISLAGHTENERTICMRFGESLTLDYSAVARKGKIQTIRRYSIWLIVYHNV